MMTRCKLSFLLFVLSPVILFGQTFNASIGDTVEIHIFKIDSLIDNTGAVVPVDNNGTMLYNLFVQPPTGPEKVVHKDQFFVFGSGDFVPKTIGPEVFQTIGQYQVFGFAEWFVASNPPGMPRNIGEENDIVIVNVTQGADTRKPQKHIIEIIVRPKS